MSSWMDSFRDKATSGTVPHAKNRATRTLPAQIQDFAPKPATDIGEAERLTMRPTGALNGIPASLQNAMVAPSTPNLREHWAARAKRAKGQRAAGKGLMVDWLKDFAPPRIRVVLIRQAPRKLDSDNLAAAMKSYRDGVADALRIDDGSPLVVWEYTQQKGPACVLVNLEEDR